MTTPPVTPVAASKAKTWWAVAGGIAMSLVPIVAQLAGAIPAPWGPALAGIMGVITAITGRAVYQAPYKPEGTVLVPESSLQPPTGGYNSTWK